ncbi:MAG TPA: type II toxin-antitoxin system VapC family toxin [Solirubrobacteraceae bacterium]|nr:type II toxin-antitoxin system VapC family toxin [Solirubrobacteraceae bacterium]
MATSGRRSPQLLVDTSVAVALTVTDHHDHEATFEAVADRRLGLAGHAAFEAFSVLTRLPAPARRTPATVARLLSANFPYSRFLSEAAAALLLADLQLKGIAGGSVYDALVGAAAAQHRLPLATRDRRALSTYRALDVDVKLLGGDA